MAFSPSERLRDVQSETDTALDYFAFFAKPPTKKTAVPWLSEYPPFPDNRKSKGPIPHAQEALKREFKQQRVHVHEAMKAHSDTSFNFPGPVPLHRDNDDKAPSTQQRALSTGSPEPPFDDTIKADTGKERVGYAQPTREPSTYFMTTPPESGRPSVDQEDVVVSLSITDTAPSLTDTSQDGEWDDADDNDNDDDDEFGEFGEFDNFDTVEETNNITLPNRSMTDDILGEWRKVFAEAKFVGGRETDPVIPYGTQRTIRHLVLEAHESVHTRVSWQSVTQMMDDDTGIPKVKWPRSATEKMHLQALRFVRQKSSLLPTPDIAEEHAPVIDYDLSSESIGRMETPSPTPSHHSYPPPEQSSVMRVSKETEVETKSPPATPSSFGFGFASLAKLMPRLTTSNLPRSDSFDSASVSSPKSAQKLFSPGSLLEAEWSRSTESKPEGHSLSSSDKVTTEPVLIQSSPHHSMDSPHSGTTSPTEPTSGQQSSSDVSLSNTIPPHPSEHASSGPVKRSPMPKKRPANMIDTHLANKHFQQQSSKTATILDLDDIITVSTPSPNIFRASFTPLIPTPTSASRSYSLIPLTPAKPEPAKQTTMLQTDILSLWDDDDNDDHKPTPSSNETNASLVTDAMVEMTQSDVKQATINDQATTNGSLFSEEHIEHKPLADVFFVPPKETTSTVADQEFGELDEFGEFSEFSEFETVTPQPALSQQGQTDSNTAHRNYQNDVQQENLMENSRQAWWGNGDDLTRQLDLLATWNEATKPVSNAPEQTAVLSLDPTLPTQDSLQVMQAPLPVQLANEGDGDEWGDWV